MQTPRVCFHLCQKVRRVISECVAQLSGRRGRASLTQGATTPYACHHGPALVVKV